jgi:hypothetical protein
VCRRYRPGVQATLGLKAGIFSSSDPLSPTGVRRGKHVDGGQAGGHVHCSHNQHGRRPTADLT